MAYSGTINQTQITVAQLIEFAFRESGKAAEEQTPQYVNGARQALFYILQNASNRGVNLWMLKSILLGTQANQSVLTLPEGTIDVREANWRYIITPQISSALPASNVNAINLFSQTLDNYATSAVAPNNWFGASYSAGQRIIQAGFNSYGAATYNFVFETSEDGVTWVLRQTLPAVTLADKEWYYFQVDPTPEHIYYRLRETVATTFSLRQISFSYTQQDIPLAKLNRNTYWSLPNKQFVAQRSLQYWFDKLIVPQMYLWPIPNNDFQVFQLVIETQLQDVGSLTNTLYVPNRWLAAIQSALSHKLAMQLPGVDLARIQYLEAQAAKWWGWAEDGEADGAPIYLTPNISGYTQ